MSPSRTCTCCVSIDTCTCSVGLGIYGGSVRRLFCVAKCSKVGVVGMPQVYIYIQLLRDFEIDWLCESVSSLVYMYLSVVGSSPT